MTSATRADERSPLLGNAAEREHRRILQSPAFHGTGTSKGRRDHMLHAIRHVTVNGLWLEFGVSTGASINFIASQTNRTVYGFDWFEGLPEDWAIGAGYHVEPKGSYRGRPAFIRPNVSLVDGLFERSLPVFLRMHNGPVAFIHVDCDLYSSTRDVLEALKERLALGTVIAFDELYNYPNYAEHEMKAFLELAANEGLHYRYLGHTADTTAASVQITWTSAPLRRSADLGATRELTHLSREGA